MSNQSSADLQTISQSVRNTKSNRPDSLQIEPNHSKSSRNEEKSRNQNQTESEPSKVHYIMMSTTSSSSLPAWPPSSAAAITPVVPVVQGVYVNHHSNYNDARTPTIANAGIAKRNASSLVTDSYYHNVENSQRTRQHQHRCNDLLFAILFLVHLVGMAGMVLLYAPKMYSEVASSTSNSSSSSSSNGRNLIMPSILTDRLDEQVAVYNNNSHHSHEEVEGDVGSENNNDGDSIGGGAYDNDKYLLVSRLVRMASVPHYLSIFNNNNDNDNDDSHYHVYSHHRHAQQQEQQQQQQEEDGYYDSINGTDDMADLMLLLCISALISLVLSTGALTFMISHAESIIKFALLFNIVATAVFAIGSLFLSPFAALMGLFLFIMTAYYACVIWGRIPFAASNLVTASTAVKCHLCGLATLAYVSLLVVTCWTLWWTATFVSTVYVTSGCDGNGNCAEETSLWVIFALLISYYWTFQVIKNVVQVTVAGTVGTWWVVPAADAIVEKKDGDGNSSTSSAAATSASQCCCCSRAVGESYLRSMTTSFGSICMGSLLVAIVEAAKNTVRGLRESEDGGGIFLCLAECLLACLRDVLEYFNMWAFVFVGLYGYPFIESGKSVLELFKSRGWTTIITDQLAEGALGLVSVAVGLVTGLVALGIAAGRGMIFGDELGASAAAFFAGFITGSVMTSTLLTLVSSAVSTVIVCYAEAPAEFEVNHPKLSQDMRCAWRQAWPEEFQY